MFKNAGEGLNPICAGIFAPLPGVAYYSMISLDGKTI